MGVLERDYEGSVSLLDSVWGVAGATAVTLLLVLGLRYVVGDFVGRGVHTLTILGTIGGAFGALLMIHIGHAYDEERIIRPVVFWGPMLGDLDPDPYTGRGAYAHITFGGILGPFSTWGAWHLGVPGGWFGTLPFSLGPAVAYALGLATIGVISLGLLDNLGGVQGDAADQAVFVALHVLYGLTLGLFVGLYEPLFA